MDELGRGHDGDIENPSNEPGGLDVVSSEELTTDGSPVEGVVEALPPEEESILGNTPEEMDPLAQPQEIHIRTIINGRFKGISQGLDDVAERGATWIEKHMHDLLKAVIKTGIVGGVGATAYGAYKVAEAGVKALGQTEVAKAVQSGITEATDQVAVAAHSPDMISSVRVGLETGAAVAGTVLLIHESSLVAKETAGLSWRLTKGAVRATVAEADTAVNEAYVPGVMGSLEWASGKLLGGKSALAVVSKFIEAPAKAAVSFTGEILRAVADMEEGISVKASKVSKVAEGLVPLLGNEKRSGALKRSARILEKNGNTLAAEAVRTSENGLNALSRLAKRAARISELSLQKASVNREMAASTDAVLTQISGLVTGRLADTSKSLLESSSVNRERAITSLQNQFNKERARSNIKSTGRFVLENSEKALSNYSAQSPVFRFGKGLVKGVGKIAKGTIDFTKGAVDTGKALWGMRKNIKW